jgi:diguanylate cyclase (GGDEF)-like protein/PAS domain S-box-containing protein
MVMVDFLTEDGPHFHLIFDSSPAAMILVDEHGLIRLANREAERLFDYECDQLLGKLIEILVPESEQAKHQMERTDFYQHPQVRPMGVGRHMRAVRKGGFEFPVEIGLTPIHLSDGLYVLCSVVDLTFQKQIEEQALELTRRLESANIRLAQLARTDELTGLKNRRAFDEGLRDLIQLMNRMSSELSLLLIDVDHFKQYNDDFGHLAGDELLKTLADLLMSYSRKSDLVARYGGEEFAILMPATNAEDSVRVGEKIRLAIQDHPWGAKLPTISLGAATISFAKITTGTLDGIGVRLLIAADQALYHSKRSGRNKLTHILDIKDKE